MPHEMADENPSPESRARERFFRYARERYEVFLKRKAGEPPPWTKDKTLAQYYFCNVFRKDDKTTVWFRERVLDEIKGQPGLIVFACVAFRMLNRVNTGEAIRSHLTGGYSRRNFERALRWRIKLGPILGPAYMVKTPPGVDKVTGLMPTIDLAWKGRDKMAEEISAFGSIEWATHSLSELPYVGRFMAYEMATDLTYTEVLSDAKDKHSWANPGPGAMRGLVRIFGRGKLSLSSRFTSDTSLRMMQKLLADSNVSEYWPHDWPAWSMREVEHTLCEFDKYERARSGQGTMKRLYHAGA